MTQVETKYDFGDWISCFSPTAKKITFRRDRYSIGREAYKQKCLLDACALLEIDWHPLAKEWPGIAARTLLGPLEIEESNQLIAKEKQIDKVNWMCPHVSFNLSEEIWNRNFGEGWENDLLFILNHEPSDQLFYREGSRKGIYPLKNFLDMNNITYSTTVWDWKPIEDDPSRIQNKVLAAGKDLRINGEVLIVENNPDIFSEFRLKVIRTGKRIT